jgi:serine---pyruvate transaminase
LEARWKRHALFSKAFQAGIKGMGLTSFPDEKSLAHTLSVPKLPESVKGSDFRAAIGKFNVVTAGGLGAVADKTIRVGHMGSDMVNDITATLAAMEMALHQLGYVKEPGAGVGAAMKVFAEA